MPRESSKCREWEKERRNRLNEAFQQLCKLLPCYDPSVNTSKLDILRNACKLIEELQEKIKELTCDNNEEKTKKIRNDEIRKLQERLRKLLSKNEQLCCLLRDAKITIPVGCGIVKKFRSHLYWSNRFTPEQVKILQNKEQENSKENNENKLKKIANKNKTNNGTPKHRKVIVNRTENKKLRTTKKKKSDNQTKPNCVIVLSKQPTVTQPCYVITNAPSNGILTNTSTVLANSNLLTTPLVSTNIKNSNNKTITPVQTSTLGPGTLILANGTIVPVLPPPPAPPPSQQTILPTQSNPTVILLPKITTNQSKSIETTKTIKTLTRIKPKYCLTRTTQANKVPIPALTSRYSNNEVVLKKTDNKTFKNDKKKLEKSNESGEKRKSIDIDKENCKKSKIDGDSGNKNGDSNEKSESNPQVVNDIVKENKSQKNSVGNTENSKDLLKTSEIDKENLPTSTVATTITKNTITESIDGNKENNNVEFSGNSENRNVVEMLEKSVNEATSTISTTTITTTTTTTIETVPVKTITTTTTTGTAAITTISIKTTQQQDVKNLELNLNHSELSNDIFATLQVPSGCQNPESTSPTAAFLLAFPLVSSLTGVKVTEVTEEDNNTVESQRGTPTLLQIGTMDTTKPTQSDNLTPNLLNLDNLSFFSTNHFYNYDNTASTTTTTTTTITTTSTSLATNKNVNLLENSGNNGTVLTDCQLKTTPTTSTTITTIPTTTKKNYTNYKSSYNYNNFDDLTTPTTKITTYSTIIKNYPDPLYTNSNTYNYNYNDNNFNQNYYKNITRTDNRNYYSLNYENYTDYRKNDLNFNTNYYSTTTTTTATTTTTTVVTPTTQFIKEKFLGNSNKNKNDRPPVNWMTTPDYNLPQFTKDNDFYIANPLVTTITTTATTTTTTYFSTINQNSNNLINNNDNNQENKKNLDLSLNYHHHHYHPHHQKNDIEDNQFSWSPTKLPQFFEPTTHSFTTLPTLVGDLSLNNSITTTTTNFLNDTKTDTVHKFNSKKDNNRRQIGNNKTYENQSNFLSVSQLVDHNKNESIPARTTNRRNSGNRSSKKVHQQQQQQQKSRSGGNNKAQDKEQNNKNQLKQINYNIQENNDLYCDSTKNHRNLSKNYSAEALISHQLPQSRQNYSTTTTNSVSTTTTNKLTVPPPFLPENPILPYFPSVDLPTQDNNYGIQQNQNYSHHHHHHHHHHPQTFGHNFSTSFQNNNYTSNSFIPPPPPPPPPPPAPSTTTSSYLSTNSFIHDMGTHDYTDNLNLFPPTTTITSTSSSAQNKDKSYNKNRILGNNQQNICSINNNLNSNGSINNIGNKKRKKQNEMNTNLPGFVDFSFFSMPGTINSPILPDDFHTGFLTTPTPQLYPCKNPLYPTKQNDLTTSTLLPPPLPPVPPNNNNNNNNNTSSGNINNNNGRSNVQHPEISPSINNAGTSLTNFNLSTIFPEINNKGVLSEPYLEPRIKDHTVRNYNSTAQVSFNDKPSFNFSYINSTSQSYNQ